MVYQTVRPSKKFLEGLYTTYNRREFVHPDPVEFLYRYDDVGDREVVALIASVLAYGRVLQIMHSVEWVLGRLTPEPKAFLLHTSSKKVGKLFPGFRHRFTTGSELTALFIGAGRILKQYGSLGACFSSGMKRGDCNVVPAMGRFVDVLREAAGRELGHLLPAPEDGSACKRLNLFLRWMVRRDDVDPGGWEGVPASKLVVPLDTHMHRIAAGFGFTRRRQADMRTALEVTAGFGRFAPQDPVRYDFALTRFGINPKLAGLKPALFLES